MDRARNEVVRRKPLNGAEKQANQRVLSSFGHVESVLWQTKIWMAGVKVALSARRMTVEAAHL